MSFVEKFKSVFRKSKLPTYKSYTAGQLKVISMKTRIYLQQHYKKCGQLIQAQDHTLQQCKKNPGDCYRVLQEIGRHVIQVQSLRIYSQILRKIQDKSASIIQTNGDIALLKLQLSWFQCLLWYRKCKKIIGLQQLYTFCYNFFKGVDITCQITPKCQIFKIFPIILYLQPDGVIPLKKIYPQIAQYITTVLQQQILQQVFKITHIEIKKWVYRQKIQYRQRYLSKSKSPIKKQISPKKYNNSNTSNSMEYDVNNSNIGLNKNKSQQFNINQQDNNNHHQNKQQPKNNMNTSFMRKILQNTKQKQKQKQKENKQAVLCIQCGKQISQQTNQSLKNLNLQQKQHNIYQQKLATFSKICQYCQQSKYIVQQKNKNNIQKQQHTVPICPKCNTRISQQNQYSFNINKQNNASNSFSFNQQLCPACLLKQQQQSAKTGIMEQNYDILAKIQQEQQKNKNKIIDNSYNEMAVWEQSRFDDQEQSLSFIRQVFAQKKKPIKKPYMVSIYARAQYMNQVTKK